MLNPTVAEAWGSTKTKEVQVQHAHAPTKEHNQFKSPKAPDTDEDPYLRSRNCEPLNDNNIALLAGPSNPELASNVARYL